MQFLFRRFYKSKSLRIINLIGLILMFSCIILSYSFIKNELSYESTYENSNRIVRLTAAYNGNVADGRLFGSELHDIRQNIPEIEDELSLHLINTATVNIEGNSYIVNDIWITSNNLLSILNIPLSEGNSQTALSTPGNVIISEELAIRLFGKTEVIGISFELSGRKIPKDLVTITGVFKKMPENSHFHTDFIVSNSKQIFENTFNYVYLLLYKSEYKDLVLRKMQDNFQKNNSEHKELKIDLMPMSDIHLHSKVLKEIEPNGNILYIYLIVGVNILLFIIVLFNLWLNSSVIFSYNKRYYQLLRLNGASSIMVIKDELRIFLLLFVITILVGTIGVFCLSNFYKIPLQNLSYFEIISITLLFLLLTGFISLLPIALNLSSTLFFNETDLKMNRFSFKGVRSMLISQYAIVIFILTIGVGVNRQMFMVHNTQLGGTNENIVVINEQPQDVVSQFRQLQDELLKCPDIESVTAAMQLPGDAIRDMITVQLPDKNKMMIPVLVVGENFFETFNIKPISGQLFAPLSLSSQEEFNLLVNRIDNNERSSLQENIIINKKALLDFGFTKPEDAIGTEIKMEHSVLDYFDRYIISGVVDNFVYTSVYEKEIPLIILQRNTFMHCFIIQFMPNKGKEGIVSLNRIWQKVNPDYPISYKYLTDSYKNIYHNELNAQRIVTIFSVLSFLITILGLLTFVAFLIRSRLKEIGIRKINGATSFEILIMLNSSFLKWILLSYAIAIPISWYTFDLWLQNFAYKAEFTWGLCVVVGIVVLFISSFCISIQTWKAANANPIDSIKNE